MNSKTDRKYAARTINELRRMALEAQDLGDKARLAAIELDIQRVLDGWL